MRPHPFHAAGDGAADGRAVFVCAAYAVTQLVLSLRFLTSTSQSLAFFNPAKPLLAAAVVLATGLFIAAVLRAPRPFARLVQSPILFLLLLAGLVYAQWHLYPLLDREALKLAGEGSDADDALIDIARRLLQGEPSYAAPTYRGNPISTGLGWVVLNLPWASQQTFFLLTPFYLGALGIALRAATRAWVAPNVALIGHLGCLGFLEIAPTSDLAALGAALCASFMAAYLGRNSGWALALIAVVMGTVSSGRVPFLLFPALSAALLWRATAGRSLILGLAGTATAAAWHLGAMRFGASPYQPLHLFDAANTLLPGAWRYIAALATAAVGIAAIRARNRTPADAVFLCGLCLATPLIFVALAQLAAIGFETGHWEGANYLEPAFSFFVAALALLAWRRHEARSSRPDGNEAASRHPT